MYLKHRGDKLYFNLFINEIRTATADAKDTVEHSAHNESDNQS